MFCGNVPLTSEGCHQQPMPVIERSEDDLYMLYTGGTTGMPKGVMYDHRSFAGGLIKAGFTSLGIRVPNSFAEYAAIVNGKALELIGIDENTTVEGGMVVVENGKATGLLIDNAIDLINYPEMKKEDKERALLDAERNCLAVGLTSICDAGLEPDTIALIGALQQKGRMKLRVNAMVAMSDRNSCTRNKVLD